MTSTDHHYPWPEPAIFRAYDIRGRVSDQLTPEVSFQIGARIAEKAKLAGFTLLTTARDGRISSPRLHQQLNEGIISRGVNVIDIGQGPTPLLYFAANRLSHGCGVMITGSHNPSDQNGIKAVINHCALTESEIQDIARQSLPYDPSIKNGNIISKQVGDHYIKTICDDVKIKKPLKIVLDCGNGASSDLAPKLFKALGCKVVPLYCENDGTFPNHHPDPNQEKNLIDLKHAITKHSADIGLAFDGDGDRLGVVNTDQQVIWPDRLMILLARDILATHPHSTIVCDVKTTGLLLHDVKAHGGNIIMGRSGHSLMKQLLRESDALLGGEYSGHIIFRDRWFGVDDGLYAGARLLEILSQSTNSCTEQLNQLPQSHNTPEYHCYLQEGEAKAIVLKLVEATKSLEDGIINTTDGIRIDFSNGWGLVRASNTTASLTMRFEGDSPQILNAIIEKFRQLILSVAPTLKLPV